MNTKKILFAFSWLCFFCTGVLAQTITRPAFKQVEVIRVPDIKTEYQVLTLTADQKIVTIEYVDGMGRPLQNLILNAAPSKKDIIQPITYDQLGRKVYTYLPYAAAGTGGAYQNNATGAQLTFYQNGSSDKVADDAKPFTKVEYENSPMQRILKEGTAGEGFQPGQHFRSVNYRTNTAADNVRIWRSDGNSSSTYPAGVLTVTESSNEDGNKTYTFTNKSGQAVLQRIQADETVGGVSEPWLETYYIYTDGGQIKYTVSPKAVSFMRNSGSWSLSSNLLNELVFCYTYDSYGRLVEKKAPGAAPVYIIYDSLDRPLLTQDGNLRSSNKWRYTKYDDKMRTLSEGIYTDAARTTRAAMQSYVSSLDFSINYCEQRQSGTAYGYSNNVFPTGATDPLLYNYYDDYDLNSDGSNDYSYQPQSLSGEGTAVYNVRGYLTASRRKVVGTGNWLTAVNFYDKRGNIIQVVSNNLLNSSMNDVKTIVPDFTGAVLKSKTVKASASATTSVYSSYSYDHVGRLKTIDDSYNGAAAIRIATYEYNELGQVVDKKLHSTNGGNNYLQSVDFRYNIRGQLLSINNSTLTSDDKNDDNNDVFGMEMLYHQTDAGIGNTAYYNGMLSAIRWTSKQPQGGSPKERSYRFDYDKLLRLRNALYMERTSGSSWGNSGAFDEKNIRYDQNGNILTLQRNAYIGGSITTMDNLAYSYEGNRLTNLSDGGSASLGYKNLTGSTADLEYDPAGNLSADPRKGIVQTYNILGRTEKMTVTTSVGRYITYTYDAAGILLRKQQYDNSILQKTTDYSGGFVYENGVLAYFAMAEGRVRNTGGTLKCEYMITDYQGNVRVSFEEQNGVAAVRQENSYYPYGLVMPGGTLPSQPNRNLYNGGSEWQNDFADLPDYYQTFYRNYDAAVGRFIGVDPYADSYPFLSPYHYAGNNPVMLNDPLGDKFRRLDGSDDTIEPFFAVRRDGATGGTTGGAVVDIVIALWNESHYGGSWNPFDGKVAFGNEERAFYQGVSEIAAAGSWGRYGFARGYEAAAKEFNKSGAGHVKETSNGGYITMGVFYKDTKGNPVTLNGVSGYAWTFFVGSNKGTAVNNKANSGGSWSDRAWNWAKEHFEISGGYELSYGLQLGGGMKEGAAVFINAKSTVHSELSFSNKAPTVANKYSPGQKITNGIGAAYFLGVDYKRETINGQSLNTVSLGIVGLGGNISWG